LSGLKQDIRDCFIIWELVSLALRSKFGFGLKKTRDKMSKDMQQMLDSFDSFNEDLYSELEELLVMGDVGVQTALDIVSELRERVRKEKIKKPDEVKNEIKEIVAEMREGGEDMGLVTVPSILLVIGVNGAGKTTTIGKLASMYKSQGKKVILGAADTFRAAAIDQLAVWADRAGVEIIRHKEGADPSAVIFDTIAAGKSREADIIICDTAGRLHNKKHLMEELTKMYRIIDKELPYSDREVLLVLDATTGQNGVNQARDFMKTAEITGIVLTKLDSTAKGGVVLSIKNELKIPVKFIGVGEKIDDLQPFDPKVFAESLFFPVTDAPQEDEDYYEKLKEDSAPPAERDEAIDAQALADALEAMFEVVEEAEQDEARDESQDEPADALDEEAPADDGAADQAGVPERQPQPQGEAIDGPESVEEAGAPVAENIPVEEPALEPEIEPEQEEFPERPEKRKTEEPKKKKSFFGGLFGKK
jgi:fused signal recognition particle receptor